MIPVTMGDIFIAYVVVTIVSLALFAIPVAISRSRRLATEARNRIQCPVCGHTYQDSSDREVTHCPRCRHANERIPPVI